MIYFDYAATTPLDSEVYQAMEPFLLVHYGNPNSKYYPEAEFVKNAVSEARKLIASNLKIKNDEVIFTSGGTESNNMIIKGIAFKHKNPLHMITTQIEHSSVIETMQYLESLGWEITYLKPNNMGLITEETLKDAIKETTVLISIGWVNSEIGTKQNVDTLSDIAKDSNILFHTDATQALGKCKIELDKYPNVNFLSMSSHKIYGPKGSGAAIIRRDYDNVPRRLVPIIHGGEQEFGYRGGTLNVPCIIGFAKAIDILYKNKYNFMARLSSLDDYFISEVRSKMKNIAYINNADFPRVPGIINVRFKGFNNQLLLKQASEVFGASTGSACSNSKPSKILEAIGLSDDHIKESIRFSLGKFTSIDDIDLFIKSLV